MDEGIEWLRQQIEEGFAMMRSAMLANPPSRGWDARDDSGQATVDAWLAGLLVTRERFENSEACRERICQAFALLIARCIWWPRVADFLRAYAELEPAPAPIDNRAVVERIRARQEARQRTAAMAAAAASRPSPEERAAEAAAGEERRQQIAAARQRFLDALRRSAARQRDARQLAAACYAAGNAVLARHGEQKAKSDRG
jgi:hypothetical protein